MAENTATDTQKIGQCTVCGVSTFMRCIGCGAFLCGTCATYNGVADVVFVICAGCFARGGPRRSALRKVTQEEIDQAYDRLWWPSPISQAHEPDSATATVARRSQADTLRGACNDNG